MSRIVNARRASQLQGFDWSFGTFLRLLRRAPLRLFGLLLAWQERVSERHHLEGLSDGMLRDVGLTREQVDRESRKPFWRN